MASSQGGTSSVTKTKLSAPGFPFYGNEGNKYLAPAREATENENKLLARFEHTRKMADIANDKKSTNKAAFDINKLGYKRAGLDPN